MGRNFSFDAADTIIGDPGPLTDYLSTGLGAKV